jgi:heme/copper-type cytochrome/quinol oxidase subunit 3
MDTIHTAPRGVVERPRVTTVGTLLACLGIAMYFAGLLGIYLAHRSAAGDAWLSDVTIPLGPPSMMMATLAISCVSVQWALWAVVRNDRLNAYVALGLTALFGLAVINSQYWMYQQMAMPIRESAQAVLLYAITGSFLALLVSAMVYIGIVTFRTLGGQYGPNQHDAVSGAVLYWYFVVAVFAVIWIAVYIAK